MSVKHRLHQSWPEGLYLNDEQQDDLRYQRFVDEWEQGQPVDRYHYYSSPGNSLGHSSSYGQLYSGPPFVHITPPPAGAMKHSRKDPYEKSKAKFDIRPKLTPIPERGARGLAAAGRSTDTLTASEIAEVHIGLDTMTISSATNGHVQKNGHAKKNGHVKNGHIKDKDASPQKAKKNEKKKKIGNKVPMEVFSVQQNGRANGNLPTISKEAALKDNMEDEETVKLIRERNSRLKVWTIAVVLLVIIAIIAAVLAVFLSMNVDGPTVDTQYVQYRYSLRLQKASYTFALRNNKSSEFIDLQKDICEVMTAILDKDLELCFVDKFTNGSVIAEFVLHFRPEVKTKHEEDPLLSFSNHVTQTIKNELTHPSLGSVTNFVSKYNPSPESLKIKSEREETTTATPTDTTNTLSVATTTQQEVSPSLSMSTSSVPSTESVTSLHLPLSSTEDDTVTVDTLVSTVASTSVQSVDVSSSVTPSTVPLSTVAEVQPTSSVADTTVGSGGDLTSPNNDVSSAAASMEISSPPSTSSGDSSSPAPDGTTSVGSSSVGSSSVAETENSSAATKPATAAITNDSSPSLTASPTTSGSN